MRSMTGFGQGGTESGKLRIAVTIRTVNHRFLDLKVRMAEDHRRWESEIVKIVRERIHRGRVDVSVDIEELSEGRAEVRVRPEVVREIQAAVEGLKESGLVVGELRAGDVLRLPEVLKITVPRDEWGDSDVELLRTATRRALAQVLESRSSEGARLHEILVGRLARLREIAQHLDARQGEIRGSLAAALRERLSGLLADTGLSEERLALEAAVLADKSDVREELDRLGAHISRFEELLARPDSIGKPLDFVSQEILRELNTVASKCRSAEMVQAVLDGRAAAEQLREQIQNIE